MSDPTTLDGLLAEVSDAMADDLDYVVLKRHRGYYRLGAYGYTGDIEKAGRWTKAEAESYASVEPENISAVYAPIVPTTSPAGESK
jgi:hypothetical protein